ncbi:hypothetical protein KMW28_12290 [Flammeovirga yaeyamensis]|uniref:Uncharacterized protein n=1 Tax=Flammeovirga yaeyamensis TaxID=367791 RepID=A0AAX1MYX6_9BACT|nr:MULTISPECIES: hypothetical protein [Flammeovirga]ANQ48135.1 hypothetical protein MY04_0753 [Flammeovirga sp. MY04]MBB3696054.1 hypothetical protein [Flammeovirga yaeyamensis]NMF34739.1 hypothetical protein [Flammeovirga yaeyamensis]QWG00432.1 hypothetical protein KMW28_12290 [Flammeovirga yaeyamensis]
MTILLTIYLIIANIAVILKCYQVFLKKMLVQNAFAALAVIVAVLVSVDIFFYGQLTNGYGNFMSMNL